jgi:hypothetical protein
MREKMAVFAPMPKASDRIATPTKSGDFVSVRIAYRMSCKVLARLMVLF